MPHIIHRHELFICNFKIQFEIQFLGSQVGNYKSWPDFSDHLSIVQVGPALLFWPIFGRRKAKRQQSRHWLE